MNEKNVVLLNPEIVEKFKVNIVYVLVECEKCHRTFGVSPVDNVFSERKLRCFQCASKQLDDLLEKTDTK